MFFADGARWLYGMSLPPDLPEVDAWLYSKLKTKWDSLRTNGEHMYVIIFSFSVASIFFYCLLISLMT